MFFGDSWPLIQIKCSFPGPLGTPFSLTLDPLKMFTHIEVKKKTQCLVSHRRVKERQTACTLRSQGQVLPSLGMQSSTWMTSGGQAAAMIKMQGPVALPVLGSLEKGPGLCCISDFWIDVEPTSQESPFLPTRHTGHSPEQPSQTCGPREGRICSHPREWGGR